MIVRTFIGRWGAVCGLFLLSSILSGCKTETATDSRFVDLPGYTNAAQRSAAGTVSSPAGQPPVGAGAASAPALGGSIANVGELDTIHPGDKLMIMLSDLPGPQPLLPIEDQVKEDGSITLIQNQTFTAAGKKRGDLEKEIRQRYVPDYYRTMTVSVRHQRETQFYYVRGDVKAAGRQVYISRLHVLGAIASAGDFTDFGDKKRVQLTRADGRIFTVNCVKAKSNPNLDLEVYPGDTIFIPRRVPWRF